MYCLQLHNPMREHFPILILLHTILSFAHSTIVLIVTEYNRSGFWVFSWVVWLLGVKNWWILAKDSLEENPEGS